MINLLPPAEKEAVAFARYNTQLRHWIVGALVGLAGVVVVVFFGQMYLQQNVDAFQKSIDTKKQQLAAQKQKETLDQVKGIQDSFKLVVEVLSREILFSELLPQVGATMPKGAILENLTLNTEGTQTAFDLSANAVNYESGSQVHANLADPDNNLFEKADLVSISCSTPEESNPYPCTVQVRVMPAQNNKFLLLNRGDN
jgi:hypothetical protein